MAPLAQMIDRISIEPTRYCTKGCGFCYNGSSPTLGGDWTACEIIDFVRDCARNGVKAVSFGGGEPLEWPHIDEVLAALRGTIVRSLTTNGLHLRPVDVEKIHISIHAASETERVIAQLETLSRTSGVNLLVRKSRLGETSESVRKLHAAGIGNDRIVYLPMRGSDTPSAEDIARIAGPKFQSMTCLSACGKSPRFVSIGADKTVAWCSYTVSRRPLERPTYVSMLRALRGLDLVPCDVISIGRQPIRQPAA